MSISTTTLLVRKAAKLGADQSSTTFQALLIEAVGNVLCDLRNRALLTVDAIDATAAAPCGKWRPRTCQLIPGCHKVERRRFKAVKGECAARKEGAACDRERRHAAVEAPSEGLPP